ncbi:ATP-dependent RNA helicase DbpA [Methanocorpusculaceae archaeon Sp1]|nr:ATP-dependent RNA helicase DbpA [Methanocorpusculaceae archaeon Sp1]
MTLDSLHLKTKYSKTQCNIVDDFYTPCMRESIYYDRLSGYFSSGIYLLVWDALQEFINNSGVIRLVCSPELTNEDKEALKEGWMSKTDEILSASLLDTYNQMLESDQPIPAKLLACLVSQDILKIKLAILPVGSLYHDKVGTFRDIDGNVVGFRGAMNETYKGLAPDGNIESIEVFSTCEGERDAERAHEAQASFDEIWNAKVCDVLVYDLPSSVKYKFLEISRTENIPDLLYELKKINNTHKKTTGHYELRKHQDAALKDWHIKGRRGILEHATGSGKTFTAICAIRDSLERGEIPLILVPSTDLVEQWDTELRKFLSEINPVILECDGNNSKWKESITNFSSSNESKNHLLLATIQTASTKDFLNKITDGEHIFFVADEVHRCGSSQYRKVFNIQSGPRLGLSATPRRYRDPEGTDAIYTYFENELAPKYTLEDAIKGNVLTEYEYHPHLVELTSDEQDEWSKLSKSIRKHYAKIKNFSKNPDDIWNNSSLKSLRIKRARILKGAHNKVNLAREVLQEYRYGDKWIVYCDSISQINQLHDVLKHDKELKKQTILQYHSDLDRDERRRILEFFSENTGILLSVRCLDEGIDIPSVSHALILASSKNPREFIQRRGRILRNHPGKTCAYLHDMIITPYDTSNEDIGPSILNSELARAIQFGRWAKNPNCIATLKEIAIKYDINVDEVSEEGYDDEQENI